MIKQNTKHKNRLYILLDAIFISLSLYLAWYIRIKSGFIEVSPSYLSFGEYMQPLFYIVPLYLIIYNLFELHKTERIKGILDELFALIKANGVGILVFLAYLYITKNIDYSRVLLILFASTCIVLTLLERLFLRWIFSKYKKKGLNIKNVVLIGFSDLAIEYVKRIHHNQQWGYNVVGIFENHVKRNYVSMYKKSVPILGKLDQLEEYLHKEPIDEVIITLTLKDYGLLGKVIDTCEKAGIFTRIIPDYNKYIPSKPYIEELDGLSVISIRKVPLNDLVYRGIKRSMDIVGSLIGLVLLSPMYLLVSLAIKLTSKGPIFFAQTRVGLNRNLFNMYKFRSMIVQDEKKERKAWTTKDDPRVTKIGKFIRRTSIDEFPQLFNVLKGDMSLVGPRPERPVFVDKFKEEIPKYMVKHQVRPGITGWAQVHGWRGDTSIKKRIEYDLYYIENWSLKLDIRILFMTIFKGMVNKNAY